MINKRSEDLLFAVKRNEETAILENQLASIDLKELEKTLSDDNQKKAFWINCYNAFYQIIRRKDTPPKDEIYTAKAIKIAGEMFSLDDIEHGILRKNRLKASLGYLPNLFAPALLKKLAVNHIDCRIHFALNCGAKSCPPIAFYNVEKIEQQLEIATLSFLESETSIFYDTLEIHTSSLMSWYRGDFGGTNGIKNIIHQKLDFPTKGFKIIYKPYSWEDHLGNFSA